VSNDHAPLARRTFENVNVWTANQLLVPCGAHIAAPFAEARYDIGSDVLVREEGEVEGLHARMFSSQVCSPLSASAA